MVEVVVGAGRAVGAERQLVAGCRRWPCRGRELDSIWFVAMKPLASLLARYWASIVIWPET